MTNLIGEYLAGPQKLREAVVGMTADQLDAKPIAGKRPARQAVCHLGDCGVVCAEQMGELEEHKD